MNNEVELTEFSDLDPDELHLVKRAATGFPALLAKSVAAEIEAAMSPVEKPRTPKLPKYVQRQVDAARHKNLANVHKENPANRSKAERVAAKSIRKSLFARHLLPPP